MTNTKRSQTGRHNLLPSSNRNSELPQTVLIDVLPNKGFVAWTLSKGIIFWRIWPAVLLHTLFAAAVVTITIKTNYHLGVPNVLITVLGVVIGFVISYRASSGYDRYWAGRTSWSDVFRNSRTFSRLIWFHVPPKLTPDPPTNKRAEIEQAEQAMREKVLALDLIEGFVIGLKHHLRGETGIYYEDLYPLVRPLHDHPHHQHHPNGMPIHGTFPDLASAEPQHDDIESNLSTSPIPEGIPVRGRKYHVPPVNSYGSFQPPPLIHTSVASEAALGNGATRSSSSESSERAQLLPSQERPSSGVFAKARSDLVPFAVEFKRFFRWIGLGRKAEPEVAGGIPRIGSIDENRTLHKSHKKQRPVVAGGGYNIPLELLRSLSDWVSVLEARGTVPGAGLGGMHGCIQTFEASLTTLEQILTTPLPFVYSVHIKHTVWFYLFTLPFQLVDLFQWYTIPGVAIATFIYLGFLAAGEEIENPFGYDENDLDLDFFCRAILHAEISQLKKTHARNAYVPETKRKTTLQNGIHELAHTVDDNVSANVTDEE